MPLETDGKSQVTSSESPDTPVLLVLLGASNLSRGCYALARHIRMCLYPRPVEVLIASGPGRAYQASGGWLNVVYPPIHSSSIFEAAQNKSESGCQVVALVTDIGNDIMYGVPPEKVIETVEQVFDCLQSMNASILYTTLPQGFEEGNRPLQFRILRSLFYPRSKVTYEDATAGIIAVNQFLRESAGQQGHLIPELDRYLGYDEIHYGWLKAHHAWSHVAGEMLKALGVEMTQEITLSRMLKSYWGEFRQVVGVDMAGFKKKQPGHF